LHRSRHVVTFTATPWTNLRSVYFQGEGGVGALPFLFHGEGGVGALPFLFQGEGGVGALPFTINTAPLSFEVTADFSPIALTRINIDAAITASRLDIVPPRYTATAGARYLKRYQ
jgi:hypothetical protein